MVVKIHTPQNKLSGYIADIVFYENLVVDYDAEKILPDGSIFLLLDMQEGEKKLYNSTDHSQFKVFKGAYLSGQHKHFIHIEVTKNASMLVVRFKPGRAHPFFDFPMSDINNNVLQFDLIKDKLLFEVRDKIINEKNIDKKFEFIEAYLLNVINDNSPIEEVFFEILDQMQQHPQDITTLKLAKKLNISQKHLISLFDKYVGLTPKALLRIFRFQKVIQQLETTPQMDWMQLTNDCGYYDQAHFIKDFYAFSGIKPTVYKTQKGEYMNFVPLK